jgi:hypothetical protein
MDAGEATEQAELAEMRRLNEKFGFVPDNFDEPSPEELGGDDTLAYTDEDYNADPWPNPSALAITEPTASGSGLQPTPAPPSRMEVDSPTTLTLAAEQTTPHTHEYSPSRQVGVASRTMT